MDEGILYSPENRLFVPWAEYRDHDRRMAVASYYSPFQVYTLAFQLQGTTQLLNAAYVADYSEEGFERLKQRLEKWAAWRSDPRSRLENPRFDAVPVAQAIATRYYPPARSDLRTITVPGDWDWHAYARDWNAAAVVKMFTLTADGRHQFTAEEVKTAAAGFGRRGDPISKLYLSKVQYDLPKPKLLYHLVDQLPLDDPATSQRPMLVLLDQLVEIAALNHKPTFVDIWYENQESGYLGHPLGDCEARLDDEFSELRAIQRHLENKTGKPKA